MKKWLIWWWIICLLIATVTLADEKWALKADLDGDNDIDFGGVSTLADNWLLYCPYNWPLR